MLKRSTLFRFPLGTFDELDGLGLKVSQPKGCLQRSQLTKPVRDGKSPKGDIPSCNPIKLYGHCRRNKSIRVHTHTHTQIYTPTELATAKKKKKTSLPLNLALVKRNNNNKKNHLRIHDQQSSLTWLCSSFHIIKVVQTVLKTVYSVE